MIAAAGCRDNRNPRYYEPYTTGTVGYQTTFAGGSGEQTQPAIAFSDLNRNFLLAYQSNIYGDPDIHAKEITAGVTFILIENATGSQRSPAIAYNSQSNQYLVVWEDKRGGAAADIYGRLIDADIGDTIGPSFLITGTAADEEQPAVAYASDSDVYCVVWQDDALGKRDIRATILDSGGNAVTGVLDVCAEPEIERDARIAYSPYDDEFFIVWTDYRNVNAPDIYGRPLDTAGSFPASDMEVIRVNEPVETADVVWNVAHRGYLVVASRFDNYDWQVVGRLLTSSGSPSGSIIYLLSSFSDQRRPRAAYNPKHGDYTIVWEDTDVHSAAVRITRRLYDPFLNPAGLAAIVSTGAVNLNPAVAVSDDETIITVWTAQKTTADVVGVVEK
jgi:hypothetical protein